MVESSIHSLVLAGSDVLAHFVQLSAGCIISVPVAMIFRRVKKEKLSNLNPIPFFVAAALLGMILPLNTFGIIPVISTLIINGVNYYMVLPLLVSNALFNTLAPFTEIGFRWNYEVGRVIFSLIIGASSGILLWKFKSTSKVLIWEKMIAHFGIVENKRMNFLHFIGNCLLYAAVFILIGNLINTYLYAHLLETFKTWFYATHFGYEIAKSIARANLFNIFFLAGLAIVDLLINPVKLAALFMVFKPKGVVVYYLYYLLWASALALSLFIH